MGFSNVAFVVWRESVEALLIIGILSAWLAQNDVNRRGARYLWGGVAAGLLLARHENFYRSVRTTALACMQARISQTGVHSRKAARGRVSGS